MDVEPSQAADALTASRSGPSGTDLSSEVATIEKIEVETLRLSMSLACAAAWLDAVLKHKTLAALAESGEPTQEQVHLFKAIDQAVVKCEDLLRAMKAWQHVAKYRDYLNSQVAANVV